MSTPQTRNPNLDLQQLTHSHGLAGSASRGGEPLSFPRSSTWWTGPDPTVENCPGRGRDGTIHALPIPDLASCTRSQAQAYFDNGWVLTELLFACLRHEEGFYRPPYHNLRHPLIFYYTHPAVLYINKLHIAGLIPRTVNPYYERLFETGVDEMSWDDLSKNEMDWPSLAECQHYRRLCYQQVSAVIQEHPGLAEGHAPITMESPLWALFMGFEHERIHLETSSVLMRELPLALLARHPGFPPLHPSAKADEIHAACHPPQAGRDFPENTWVQIRPGPARIGKDPHFPTYGWDNEYGHRSVEVSGFATTRYLITNGEFYEFVKSGAYRDQVWWTEEGWRWRTYRNAKWPTFWVPTGAQGAHTYALRTCFEVIAMPWSWPVVVNYHEAKAFAAWRTAQEDKSHPLRLLTEAEHHRLRREEAAGATPADIASAEAFARNVQTNLALRYGSESPVDAVTDEGVSDVFGNVWQWLEDHFHPLPGFAVHTYYDDFSTPCFDGKHQMIMGGSFISTGDEASLHARFHFRPHFFQHAGFRLVDPLRPHNRGAVGTIEGHHSDRPDEAGSRDAELFSAFAPLVDLVMGPWRGDEIDRLALPALLKSHIPAEQLSSGRALDIGCGVGGMSYELAQLGFQTTGCDISRLVIDLARSWQSAGSVSCQHPDRHAPESYALDPKICARIDWRQCDASSLPADWVDYDCVLIKQLLSFLPSPKSLLSRLGGPRGLVRPGGYVLLADRFDWKSTMTPEVLWLSPDPEAIGRALGREFTCLAVSSCLHVHRPAARQALVDQLYVALWRRQP